MQVILKIGVNGTFIRNLRINFKRPLKPCHRFLSVISIGLGEFPPFWGPQNTLKILYPLGSTFANLLDKAVRDLRVFNLWRKQVERKDTCFNSACKSIMYLIAEVIFSLRGRASLYLEKHRSKASNVLDRNYKNYKHFQQFTQSYITNPFC